MKKPADDSKKRHKKATNSPCMPVLFSSQVQFADAIMKCAAVMRGYGCRKDRVVEMIENVYPMSKREERIAGRSRTLPRNIRACGQGGGTLPVYIEDYVETYIRRLTESGFPECSAVILVGQVMETEIGRCLFVRGAINASKICDGDRPVFGESIWSEVYEKIRLYFPCDEVVGWCIAGPGFRMLQEDVFLRAHIDNFADSEKVFCCYESLEKELVLRICEGGSFRTLPGYYIYYEKNDEMQSYMLEEAEVSRRVIREKTEGINEDSEKKGEIERLEELRKKKEEKSGSFRKDIMQLAAIACILVLIVSVMVGTDTLAELKDTLFTNNSTAGETQALSEDGVGTEDAEAEPENDPDGLAFADFAFLDDEEQQSGSNNDEEVKQTETKGDEQANAGDEDVVLTGDAGSGTEDSAHMSQEGEKGENAEASEENEEGIVQTAEQDDPDKIEEETVTVLSPAEYTSYMVQPGDTLAQICKKVYGSVELLNYVCELNQLKDVDSIYAGQELILPKK